MNVSIRNMVDDWNRLVSDESKLPRRAITREHMASVTENIHTLNNAQSGNARVLANSIMCALGNKTAGLAPEGMVERRAAP